MKTRSEPGGWAENAALLYYQAFLLYEQPEAALEQMLQEFRAGAIGSNETIRAHVEKNRRVIEYAVKAAGVPQCDWGYDYSQGIDLALTNLRPPRRLAVLLWIDARLLAEKGDYRTALGRCLTAYKMARHVVDPTLLTYVVGIGLSGVTNRTVEAVLGTMPGDVETLNRLKVQLSQVQEAFPLLENVLVQEGQVCAATMRKDKVPVVIRVLEQDDKDFAASVTKQRLLAGDEAFFERNRTHWFHAITAIVGVLKSGQPYPQIYAQLDEMDRKVTGEAKDNPDATFTAFSLAAVHRIYLLATRLQTHFHALKIALDFYTARAKTGKLPEVLPAGAPLDLFSGQPFEYERAMDHFTLRCRGTEAGKDKPNEHLFKLAK